MLTSCQVATNIGSDTRAHAAGNGAALRDIVAQYAITGLRSAPWGRCVLRMIALLLGLALAYVDGYAATGTLRCCRSGP